MRKKIALLLVLCIFFSALPLEANAAETSSEIVIGISNTEYISYYVRAVKKAGAIPYIMPTVKTEKEAEDALWQIDALVLTGGEDIHPSIYGEVPTDKIGETNLERDISDILLLKKAMDMDMPILAICRGMQLLNIVRGGELYQDISSEYDQALVHKNEALNKGVYHMITIEDQSHVKDVMKKKNNEVYSLHHQAIDTIGDNLAITAWSKDGIIEAVEATDEEYVVGVQFHPECYAVYRGWKQLEFFEKLEEKGAEYRERMLGEVSAPTVSVSNKASTGKIVLKWNAGAQVEGYQIFRSTSENGSYKMIGETSTTSYTDRTAVAGKRYYYYVCNVLKYKGVVSDPSNVVTRRCDLARPVVKVSNIASSGKVKVSWGEIDGAVKYRVYRATSKNGTYKLMMTTMKTSYINTSATSGKTYYYKVVAVAENKYANSAASAIKSRKCL